MELHEAIWHRRMTRRFRADPVAPEVLDRVLAAASRAPSAGFTQAVELLTLTTPTARARFWELASDADWRASERSAALLAAPVIIVVVTDPGAYTARYREPDKTASLLGGRPVSEWGVPYPTVDAAFAAMLLLLAAEDAGLGGLFFQIHGTVDDVLVGLGVPPGRTTIGAVALGLRALSDARTSPARRPRRALQDIVHRERW